MNARLLIIGAGYSGRAIAHAMAGEVSWVGGTTRSPEKFAAIAETGAIPLLFDGKDPSDDFMEAAACATHIIQCAAPDGAGDPLLSMIGNDLPGHFPALEWIGYLSTVGVYGDHGGAWVDEETICRPVSDRSIMRLTAETAWQDAAASAGLPLAILRLSGIYGPGRNAFVNLRNGRAKRLIKPGQVFNRIHVEDIAGAAQLLTRKRIAGTFNVTDDEPAPPQDVVNFAADLMGVAPPPETDFATADLRPMARSFYAENKRVSNGRIKATGYRFRFPDYRVALKSLRETEASSAKALPAQ